MPDNVPGFLIDTKAYIELTRGLPLDSQGLLIDLLAIQQRDGDLPEYWESIAEIAKCGKAEFFRAWTPLMKFIEHIEGSPGRIRINAIDRCIYTEDGRPLCKDVNNEA